MVIMDYTCVSILQVTIYSESFSRWRLRSHSQHRLTLHNYRPSLDPPVAPTHPPTRRIGWPVGRWNFQCHRWATLKHTAPQGRTGPSAVAWLVSDGRPGRGATSTGQCRLHLHPIKACQSSTRTPSMAEIILLQFRTWLLKLTDMWNKTLKSFQNYLKIILFHM